MDAKAPSATAKEGENLPENPAPVAKTPAARPEEFGGNGKAEPTRYGDWEVNGRCVDF